MYHEAQIDSTCNPLCFFARMRRPEAATANRPKGFN